MLQHSVVFLSVFVFLSFSALLFRFQLFHALVRHTHTIQWYTCTKTLDLTAKIDRSARRCSLSMKICFSSRTRRTDYRTRSTERLIAAVQFSRSQPRAHTITHYPVTLKKVARIHLCHNLVYSVSVFAPVISTFLCLVLISYCLCAQNRHWSERAEGIFIDANTFKRRNREIAKKV